MRYFPIIILFLFSIASARAQYPVHTYAQYKMSFDGNTKVALLTDTITGEQKEIRYPYLRFTPQFKHGLIYVRTGDMKGLMNLKGEQLLGPSHFIRFNTTDSVICAFVCRSARWVYLDFKGNELSSGKGTRNNYFPPLNTDLNPAPELTSDGWLWGYLNCKGEWVVKPRFIEAEPSVDGIARANYFGVWGTVGLDGTFTEVEE